MKIIPNRMKTVWFYCIVLSYTSYLIMKIILNGMKIIWFYYAVCVIKFYKNAAEFYGIIIMI